VADEEHTFDDGLPPGYGPGPPTIPEQPSPFAPRNQPKRTIQGMPAAVPSPKITAKSTTPGMPSPAAQVLAPPKIVNLPQGADVATGELPPGVGDLPADGPTIPDGVPAMLPRAPIQHTPPSDGEVGLDEMPTDPWAGRRLERAERRRGTVPSPDDPKVEISKSMEYDVSQLDLSRPDPAEAPSVPAAQRIPSPTEVLPAMERKKKKKAKDRSEVWLVVGLLVLVTVIFGLVGAVVVGVMQRFF